MTGRVLAISPHCDDAVFGCGDLLAAHPGAVVVTVFAGRPPGPAGLTEWDRACGFRAGDDVVARRREEDRAALAVLGASPIWLDFPDAQYGGSPAAEEVAAALERVLADGRPAVVLPPLGLFHSDHRLAHTAALAVLRRRPDPGWLAYEDAMYRRIPGLVQERLQFLEAAGLRPRPQTCAPPGEPGRKRRAVACYRSQLLALSTAGRPGYADALAPERYWRLAP